MTDKSDIIDRGKILQESAAREPERPMVICGDRVLSRAKLNERARNLAKGLYGLGMRPGDRAAVMIYNYAEFWEISIAVGLLGCGSVPVGYRNQAPEIEYIVGNSDSNVFFFYKDFAERILSNKENYPGLLEKGFVCIGDESLEGATHYEKLIENPSDVDLDSLPKTGGKTMIYTSGTTGKPKGATRNTGPRLGAMLSSLIKLFKYAKGEVHLVSCPLYHSAPLAFSAPTLLLGGTMVLMPRFEPMKFLETIEKHKVNSAFIVPTILDTLLQVPEETIKGMDLSSLRTLICGGAPLFPRIKLGILDRFGPVLYEFYGSTEAGLNTILTPEDMRKKPDSVGKAFPENELKILDDDGNEVPVGERGDLYIYNQNMMEGYYNNEEATKSCYRGKYMTVGDVAVVDEDGYYYIVDRKKDMIIRAGVNIYPTETEDVIHGMPGVKDVAVFGVQDDHWGEIVGAYVVPEEGVEITLESVRRYCDDKLAHYKIPEKLKYRDEIPRSPQGKILKRLLREEMAEEMG